MRNKWAFSVAYVSVAILLLSSSFIVPQGKVEAASGGEGKRAGIYIAVSQTDYPYSYSTAQDFMNAYSQSGLFTTILFYAQAGDVDSYGQNGDFTRVVQMAQAAESIPNFKMIVDFGFDIGSSSDWSAVESTISQLASYSDVGWVGIEGEHSTYAPSGTCEFGATGCDSLGQAWNNGNGILSASQLESYFSQFDSMAVSDGLGVAHYYVTFGPSSWVSTQPAIYVVQWPACGFSGSDYPNCSAVTTSTSQEIQQGNSAPYIGISGGLSTNAADYWNPSVSGLTTNDADGVTPVTALNTVIGTYISVAEQQPSSARQLVLFETGAYDYIPDWARSVFTNDLQSAMSLYSDWIYPGSPPTSTTSSTSTTTSSTPTSTTTSSTPTSTTTSSIPTSTTTSTSTTTPTSTTTASTSSTTTTSSSPTTSSTQTTDSTTSTTDQTTTASQTNGSPLYSLSFSSYPNGGEPSNWYYDPSFSVQNGLFQSDGSTGYQVAYYEGQTFSDFTYSVTATGLSASSIGGQQPPVLALAFRMQDRIDGYWFWGDIDKIQIVKWVAGESTVLATQEIGQINPTGTFTLSVTVSGSNLTADWNNQYEISASDTTYSSGYLGVGTYHMDAGFNNLLATGEGTATTTSETSSSSTSTATSSSSTTTSTSSSSASSTSTLVSRTPTAQLTTSTPVTTGSQSQEFSLSINGDCPATGAGAYTSGSTATATFPGVCDSSGGSRLRVTSWSLDGGVSVPVLTNGTVILQLQMSGPHTLSLQTVNQYLLTLDYGAELSLLSITSPTIPGDYYWYDSGTPVTYVGSINSSGFSVVGWELDGSAPNSIVGAVDLETTLLMTAPHTLTVLLAPAVSSCSSSCGSAMFDVTIGSNSNLPSGVWVDGTNYPRSVTFAWQSGSIHNVTAAEGGRQPSTRTQFSHWSGISNSTLPTVILIVNKSGSLTANYSKEYLVSLRFTDALDQPLTPSSVTVSGPSGARELGANLTTWVASGETYTLSSAIWMNWNSVMASDSTFGVDGPAQLTFQLSVYPQTIRATDAYGLPLQGATVNVTTLDGATLFVITNSSGVASFRVPVGLFSARVNYLGVSSQVVSSTEGSHNYYVTFILSYPLIGTIATITGVISAVALLRLRKKQAATTEYLPDSV